MIAAIFIIMFVYGWNQYLWPMLMTTDESFYTLMRGGVLLMPLEQLCLMLGAALAALLAWRYSQHANFAASRRQWATLGLDAWLARKDAA